MLNDKTEKKKLKNKTKLELKGLTYQAHDIGNKNEITTKKASYNKL
jgi:hypothetical protein